MTPIPIEYTKREGSYETYLALIIVIIVGLAGIWALSTPANALEFNTSLPGERNVGEWFTFTMNNVSGQEDVTHHFTVYDSKILPNDTPYRYWSVYFGQWLNQTPDTGKKWLFVWVEDWIAGTPIWPYDQSRFNLWIAGNLTVTPEPIQMEDMNPRQGKKLIPAIIEGVTYGSAVEWRQHNYYGDPYGWRDGFELPYIQTGKSNSWSGWIKYQVPNSTQLDDIRVAGWFMNWGTAYWNLVPVSFVQVAPTPIPALTPQPATQQGIIRTSDWPGAPVIEGRERG